MEDIDELPTVRELSASRLGLLLSAVPSTTSAQVLFRPQHYASHLGLLSPVPSTTSPTIDGNVALKEIIILAARGEIEATASVLAKVKTLEKHINPPYLRDISQFSARLGQLDRRYTAQATEATRINERAESARLHYSQAVELVSEKFVHWDDQVAELERQHASRPS